ncbi:CapA family protein [Streptomonospora sp. PA3]|uniref:CapA family protein n=1 Tax=Streptomonospora sp. PA3 TaxID=2607326 RepID=UPI0012DEA055|nr:CapA family protein [Streptomonospora sp. PA3]MUL43759.1 CapA family protein [Streptomonospora sp. PA3]
MAAAVTVFLCGDVMLGRGVDRILPHPGDPELRESHVRDARDYVRLAEARNGPVPAPVDPAWPWGDALAELERAAPDARVVNLETAVTRSGDFAPGKAVHYRMAPANLPCLRAVRPDACVLANNHVLDFGRAGLAETLDTLAAAGLRTAGAGRDAGEAWRPAVVPLPRGGGRLLIFSAGAPSSGVPPQWAAAGERPGVAYVPELSMEAAAGLAERIRRAKRPGDIAAASIHWGGNWGYGVAPDQTRFARALIDGGADIVHGHSAHHPRPVEVYRGRLVLYGCGDLVNDYEGIPGHEEFRGDLRLLYLAAVEPGSGRLAGLRMIAMRSRRLRLERAAHSQARWLQETLDRISRDRCSGIGLRGDGTLALVSPAAPA